ncbi:uncharacterized protein DNG_00537 [Cephalotrichum gorgonifer]|uniref:Uncharacterized protein n=1 Tax=Cephalotrichum gorgonifer TaxID=2041049 RepID=A0AAE8MPB1_9PEZI|nr:uncharacterized protein DNG_00537 [Cephalotrichum gorgonifer]
MEEPHGDSREREAGGVAPPQMPMEGEGCAHKKTGTRVG